MAKCALAPWQPVRQLANTQQFQKGSSPLTLADDKPQGGFGLPFLLQHSSQLSIREGNGWLVSDRQEHWFCYCGRIEMEATAQRDSVQSVGMQRLPSTGWRSMRGAGCCFATCVALNGLENTRQSLLSPAASLTS